MLPWRCHGGCLGPLNSVSGSSTDARQHRLVDEADHYANDHPLDEVNRRLFERQFQPDIQVDIVVQDERANREDADQSTKAGTFYDTRTALVPELCIGFGI